MKNIYIFKKTEGCVCHNFSLSFHMNFQYFGYTLKKIKFKKLHKIFSFGFLRIRELSILPVDTPSCSLIFTVVNKE